MSDNLNSDSGDMEIMNATTRTGEGRLTLTCRGETIKSEPNLPDDLNVGIITAWTEMVRGWFREQEAKPAGGKRAEAPAAEPAAPAEKPEDYIKHRFYGCRARLRVLQAEFESLNEEYEGWKKLFEALELEEEDDGI